jgi:hypothetical protein
MLKTVTNATTSFWVMTITTATYQTTWSDNPEQNINFHCHENVSLIGLITCHLLLYA